MLIQVATSYINMKDTLIRALKLHQSGDLEAANDIYSELLQEYPQDVDLLYLVSLVAYQAGSTLDAVHLIAYSIKQTPQESLPYFLLGFLSNKLDWDKQCMEAYQRAVVRKSDFAEALSNLGFAYTTYNQYEQALRCYKAAVQMRTSTYAAYIGMAVTLSRMGLQKDALDAIGIVSRIRPDLCREEESERDLLARIEQSEPILYEPPVLFPTEHQRLEPENVSASRETGTNESENTEAREAAHVVKSKPRVSILHQLPGSGGSLVIKCLSTLPGVSLLNNVHPQGHLTKLYPVHLFQQAQSWYQLFSDSEKQSLTGKQIDFLTAMKMIHQRIADQGNHLLLRSWSHLDFIGKPFLDEPSGTFSLSEILKDEFDVKEYAVVRHPVETWRNFQQYEILQNAGGIDAFLKGYREFAECADKTGYTAYESFCREPDQHFREICSKLELPYDSQFLERWKFENRVGREPGEQLESIDPANTPEIDSDLLEQFEINFDYWSLLKKLGYEHPEITKQEL